MTTAPLYNAEVEQGLVGLIMADATALATSCGDLEPEHFYDQSLADIFATCRQMQAQGKRAAAFEVAAYYQTNEQIKSLGGSAFFAKLVSAACPPISGPHYASIIRDLYVRRCLAEEAERVLSELQQMPVDEKASEYASDLATRVADLAIVSGARKTRFGMGEVMAEAVDRAAEAYQLDGSRPQSVSTGIPALDRFVGGFDIGSLVIVAGRPSMGKTCVAIEMARANAAAGVPVDYNSMEMGAAQLGFRLLSSSILGRNVSYQRIKNGHVSEDEFHDIAEAARALAKMPLTIIDNDAMTITALGAEVARSKARRPDTRMVVVDYLGLIRGTGSARQNRQEEVSQITAELKRMARRHGVVMVVLAQINRGVESRDNKRPQVSDLRESGSIEQDADVIIFPFRESYYLGREEPAPNTTEHIEWRDKMAAAHGQMEILIAKNREGRIGTVRVGVDMATNKFTDIAGDNAQPEMF